MTLTDRELTIVQAVFEEVLAGAFGDANLYLGSVTIEGMQELYSKLYHREYCERHGIKYEDMTDDDFERAYLERYEC